MNKTTKITLILSFAAFAASVYSLAAAAAYQPDIVEPAPTITVSHTDNTSSVQPDPQPSALSDDPYRTKIIRLQRDKIAVFEEDSNSPIKVLPTDISQLPENAIERLKQGVYAYTEEQYQNYIEDFS